MDQRATVIFEVKVDDQTYGYHVPIGGTWAAAMKAASEIFTQLQEHVKKLQEESDKKAAEQAQPTEIVPEVIENKEA